MDNLIEIHDSKELVPTKNFPWAKWKFEFFNPVQSSLVPFASQDCNGLVAAATSAGKTVVSEIFGSYSIRELRKKFVFLCPLRALANEKYNDWTSKDHHFSDLNIGIYTGDYTDKDGFDDNDVIIMTSEMLNHKVRLAKKDGFLKKIHTLVVDESHMLGMEGRGPHLECALMNFTKINPECRIILLSGTLPNVNQVANWMQATLNKKNTFIIKSSYRPCVLKTHIVTYDQNMPAQIAISDECTRLVNRHMLDKFIIFVHSKVQGNFIIDNLASKGIDSAFHNANLDKKQRELIEEKFKNDKNFRVIVATSTLAQGLNLPARRVIVAGVHRGSDLVPSYEILQMCGRAGRPAFDTEGDAYVIFPENNLGHLQKVCLTAQPVISKMLDVSDFGDYATLAFHLVAEIYDKRVRDISDAKSWLQRSLAVYQNIKVRVLILEETLDKLCKIGILVRDENHKFSVTSLGKVSVMFYVNPFSVAAWAKNFSTIFTKTTVTDVEVCLALANVSDNLVGGLSKDDKVIMHKFMEKVSTLTGKQYPDNILKYAFIYHGLMYGSINSKYLSISKTLQQDFPRLIATLQAIDGWSKKWNQSNFFRTLQKRVQYGVPAKLVDLIDIKGIGKIRAEKLYDAGFRTKEDIKKDSQAAAKIAGVNADSLKNI